MPRANGRGAATIRPVKIRRRFTKNSDGSVLIKTGDTHVLCTANVQPGVPAWREGSGLGWLTAEYDMLPGATTGRRPRNRSRIDGRSQEIQRLIGRALRSIVDMSKLAENTIVIDCDVIQADGGTRTASVTAAFIALADAVSQACRKKIIKTTCIRECLAAVSVGIVDGKALLDLDYQEDSRADVDLNLVMTAAGQFVEIQGTAEASPFSRQQLDKMLDYGQRGIRQLIKLQRQSLGGSFKCIG